MNSNRLHKIFSKKKLSREDIQNYPTSSGTQKNEIEQLSMEHQFNSDAMDGWEANNYSIDSMRNLDKKFAPKSTIWVYWTVGAVILTSLFVFFIFAPNSKESIVRNDLETPLPQPISIEKTDVLLPDSINDLVELPVGKQILKETLIPQKSVEKIESDTENTPSNEIPIEIETIPLQKIETTEPEIILKKQTYAKEIYLNDFKLVDYRNYRSKPTITIEKMILGGTPASKEDKYSETLEYEWKNYDIPYIDYIDKTTAILSKKRLKKALHRLQTILETYPNDVNAHFYTGLCLMNLNELKKAIHHFEISQQHKFSNFNEEAKWLTALCYSELNPLESKKILQEIIHSNGFYSDQAKEKLKLMQ